VDITPLTARLDAIEEKLDALVGILPCVATAKKATEGEEPSR
jgi:hypothetical protein